RQMRSRQVAVKSCRTRPCGTPFVRTADYKDECREARSIVSTPFLRGGNNTWGLPGALSGGQDLRRILLRPVQAHLQVNRVIGSWKPVRLFVFARRVSLNVER